ncbi:hypothetical protein [Fulvimonas yonginensis]|uniref:YfhD family protein n=1 Tax=Fulvimonas yonginensis TaxID=1495200 RepID=A0ABU8JDN7_9GAMM
MAETSKPPHDTDARRGLDRDYTGQATNAMDEKVEDEVDQETHRLQREYDADAPKNRH